MNIEDIKARIKPEDISVVDEAYNYLLTKLDETNYENRDFLLQNIMGVINTLVDFNADSTTIVSGILYNLSNIGIDTSEIEKIFGNDVANIVLKTAKISKTELLGDSQEMIDDLNKLSPDSPVDVRCLFIKLASRLHHMKSIDENNLYKRNVARETLDLLIPAARRLKLNFIKSRIEDLCLKFLNPEAYDEIFEKLKATPNELMPCVVQMRNEISELLTENGIEFTIKGRVKNFYSIYNKIMSGKSFHDIYDILALRVVVKDTDDCDRVIDIIHAKYPYLPERFKDYINNPKANSYQSLHTTILGSDRQFYEVQVRTQEMHKNAEEGLASHSAYKEKIFKKVGL